MAITPLPGSNIPSVGGSVTNSPVLIGGVAYRNNVASNTPISTGPLPLGETQNPASNPTYPSPNPPHLNFQFDTIGQPIPRTIGHVRLGLKPIWVKGLIGNDISGSIIDQGVVTLSAPATAGSTTIGVTAIPLWMQDSAGTVPMLTYYSSSGVVAQTSINNVYSTAIGLNDPLVSDLPAGTQLPISAAGGPAATITAAFALCQPLDPSELGNVTGFFDGANQVYSLDEGGLILPSSWTVVQQGQLTSALNGAVVYPGTEGQLPDPLIVAERGADKTPAFRGLRYIIIQDYPLIGNGILSLSIVWRRSNTIVRQTPPPRPGKNVTAVQFAAGAS